MTRFKYPVGIPAIVLVALLTVASTTPTEKKLPVDLFGQQTDAWCWVASAQMVHEYHSDEFVEQCALVHEVSSWKDCCSSNVCDGDGLAADYIFELSSKAYGFNMFYGPVEFESSETPEEDATASVVYQIDDSLPFVFRWSWGGGHSGSHEMVAFGYKKRETPTKQDRVWVHDPLPVGTGDTWLHTYPFFCKATSSKVRINPITGTRRTFWAHRNTVSFIDITPP